MEEDPLQHLAPLLVADIHRDHQCQCLSSPAEGCPPHLQVECLHALRGLSQDPAFVGGMVAGQPGKNRFHRAAGTARLAGTATGRCGQGVPARKKFAGAHPGQGAASLGNGKVGKRPIAEEDLPSRTDNHHELGHCVDNGAEAFVLGKEGMSKVNLLSG